MLRTYTLNEVPDYKRKTVFWLLISLSKVTNLKFHDFQTIKPDIRLQGIQYANPSILNAAHGQSVFLIVEASGYPAVRAAHITVPNVGIIEFR